jgi:thermostable 8-oxoguanine DNA glycosylase
MKDINKFYEQHEEEYSKINEKLERVNKRFLESDRENQRRMILDSYMFAVLSIQTPVDIHEEAFRSIKAGEDYESAMKSVNYWKNKVSYIRETEVKFEEIDRAIDLLEENKTDKAQRVLIDEFKGVGTVKSAFTLAMLGFTDKACIDTNVLTALGMDREDAYNGVVVEKYNEFVDSAFEEIDSEFKRKAPNTFMNQWVVFDAVREEFTNHEVFFENVGVEA